MPRPQPIFVPSSGGLGGLGGESSQTNVGIDLGAILDFINQAKAKKQEEEGLKFLAERLGLGAESVPEQVPEALQPQQDEGGSFLNNFAINPPKGAEVGGISTEALQGLTQTNIGNKFLQSLIPNTGGDKEFAPQVATKYIPAGTTNKRGDALFQAVTFNDVSAETTPITKNGEPIFLTEKQVLIAEGKKANSLIDPFSDSLLKKLGESEGTRVGALRGAAEESRNSLFILNEGLGLVDSGIYTGTAANIKKGFDKWLQEAGINVAGKKAARTETYAGLMGLQVGKVIKQFGSGTGLSDADREYAERIAGGQITMTEGAILRLLDINKRLALFTITEYNRQAKFAQIQLDENDPFRLIDVPEFGGTSVTPSIPVPGEPDFGSMTDEELDAFIQRGGK